jgi:hypothetical protein
MALGEDLQARVLLPLWGIFLPCLLPSLHIVFELLGPLPAEKWSYVAIGRVPMSLLKI